MRFVFAFVFGLFCFWGSFWFIVFCLDLVAFCFVSFYVLSSARPRLPEAPQRQGAAARQRCLPLPRRPPTSPARRTPLYSPQVLVTAVSPTPQALVTADAWAEAGLLQSQASAKERGRRRRPSNWPTLGPKPTTTNVAATVIDSAANEKKNCCCRCCCCCC